MSADNGIYILKTKAAEPLIDSDFEYRVIEAGAIENLYFDPITGREGKSPIPEELYAYFGKEQVFRYERDAWNLAEEMLEACPLVEYGICVLDHSDIVFPSHLTDGDVLEYNEKASEAAKAYRREEEKRREERREASLVLLLDKLQPEGLRAENGGTFKPVRIYGHLEKGGKEIHGSLEMDMEGRTYFLPSDWNEER